MNKKIKIVIILFIVILLIPITVLYMPIKKVAKDIDITEHSRVALEEGTHQIYVRRGGEDGADWAVVGMDNMMFTNSEIKMEYVKICGNFPKELNKSLINNTYVLDGECIGTVKYTTPAIEKKIFKINRWGILGNIKTKNENIPRYKKYLTYYDYGWGGPFETGVTKEANS